jgi:hypothetical protein
MALRKATKEEVDHLSGRPLGRARVSADRIPAPPGS